MSARATQGGSERPRRPPFLDELCRRLVRQGAQRIHLFGSWARGEADEDSDVDLVVIQETRLPFFDRMRRAAACVEPDWPADILVYTSAEFEAMRERGNALAALVLEEGVLLYGQ
jgi:predicted nucleotidyltransferase